MLELFIPECEYFDEDTQEFGTEKAVTLNMEHSLVSISRWESKYKKPFLSNLNNLHPEEFVDYLKFMTLTKNVPNFVYTRIMSNRILLEQIMNYMNDTMTATTFSKQQEQQARGSGGAREIVTSEIIYYWMTQLQIPFTCEKWNINRLLTLIKVCNIKQTPAKKMTQKDVMAQNKALNAARRAKHNSKG